MLREELEQASWEAERIASGAPAFASRARALDFLETHFFDRIDLTIQPDLRTIETRGRSLQNRLETENAQLVAQMRKRITEKNLRGSELARALREHAGAASDERAYDAMDLLVGMLLDSRITIDLEVTLDAEMVAYQPTPARAILDATVCAQVGAHDVLCDLGSGLGWVTILVALVTRAQCIGIEIEPAYVKAAERIARELDVGNAKFVVGDLLATPLPDATIYFSYTPLRGALMEKLIERLREKSREHPIRICALGPCLDDFSRAGWLVRADAAASEETEIGLFHSVS
jgi:protein-L-isoaspartate O-methyltransferase